MSSVKDATRVRIIKFYKVVNLDINNIFLFSAECGSCRTCAGEEGDIGGEGKNRTSIFFIKVYLIGVVAPLVCVTPT